MLRPLFSTLRLKFLISEIIFEDYFNKKEATIQPLFY
jgi:hypothetical protein